MIKVENSRHISNKIFFCYNCIESDMTNVAEKKLRYGVEKYQEVKRCLEKLDKNLDEKEEIIEKAVIAQHLVVNMKLKDYFKILKDKVENECTDAIAIVKEYADIYGVCKETVQKVEMVTKEKKLQDHIEEVRQVKTKKELSDVITAAMVTIRKEINKIKDRIEYEERRDDKN